MITYAQNFEDVMLERLFKGQRAGLYLDIGAWDPVRLSVTKHFYDKGWCGINVEPIRSRWQAFQRQRPRDLNLNVAVGAERGRLQFYECTDRTELSTMDPRRAAELEAEGYQVAAYEVEVVTLEDLFAMFKGRTIDFLKVDVEGYEAEVLKGATWRNARPRVLVIEATKPAAPPPSWDHVEAIANWQHWEPILLEAGYVFAHFDGLSRFYVRGEDAPLARRLRLPPCLYDQIVPYELALARQQLAECRRALAHHGPASGGRNE